MAYEKATDLSCDVVYKIGGINSETNKPNPKQLEGYYLGKRTTENANGTSTIHVFQTPKGNEGAWGTADLNTKLSGVALGTKVKIEYGEKKKLQGGKTKHIYNVYFDKEDTIEVAGGSDTTDSAESSFDGETEEYSEDHVDEGAQNAAQARREEVQNILRNKGKRPQ